jgi:hypothetical protein
MNPAFRLIVWMLQNHGAFVSSLFVYVAVPLIAWCLGRRSRRKKTKAGHTFVLVIRPPAPMSSGVPPVIRWNFEPPDDASGPFGDS